MARTPKHVEPLAIAAGALAVLSGLAPLLGALLGTSPGAPVDGEFAARAGPASAAAVATSPALLACGVAALCAGLGRARVLGLGAAVLAIPLAAAALGGVGRLAALGILPSAAERTLQAPMNAAVCLLLAGGSLALLQTRRRFVERLRGGLWLSGVVVACLGGAALLARLPGFARLDGDWSPLVGIHWSLALPLVALGLACLALLGRNRLAEEPPSWAGVGVGLGTGLGVLAIWAALVVEERQHIERTLAHAVASARFRAALDMNGRLDGVVRMAERWGVGRVPLREEWEADARLYVSHGAGMEALIWIDPGGRPRLSVARAGSAVSAADVAERLRAEAPVPLREARLSRSFVLGDGERALVASAPIWQGDRYGGCIAAVFRSEAALAPVLVEIRERYAVAIRDAVGELLSPPQSGPAAGPGTRELALALPGADWRVRVRPRPAWLAEMQSDALELVLGAGLALAVLAGRTVSLARTARQRLRGTQELLESAPDAMVVVDRHGEVVLVNAETERLFGFPRGELLGRSVDRLVPERLLPGHRRGRQLWFDEPGRRPPGPIEVTARRSDGSEFPAEISLRTIASERGDLVSTAIRDLTGRRDEELRRRLAAIVTSSSDAIFGTARDGSIVDWNAGAEQVYGWSAQEAIGRHVSILVPDERRGEMHRILESVLEREAVEKVETLRVRKGGEPIHVSLTVSPIRDESGAVVGAASIGRDVTELERTREHLRLQRDALAAANAELARSNSDLDQFAAVVSHDLKSPLRGISSLAEWLAEDHGEALGQEGREQLSLLRARIERMYRLIDGILEYSRAGRSPKLVAVDLRAIALDVIDGLEPPDGIQVELEGHLPRVVYDVAQLTQVLQNLVDNAIRHLGRPRGRVRVSAHEGADEWEVHVSDDGVGVPDEHRERIFRIFRTLDGDAASTGVGLAVVKKIVESNGGRVWVTARDGGGSDFGFTVPKRSG